MCPAKAREQGANALMLGCLLHINGDTVAAAFDTLSEVSVVGPELITPDIQATPGVGVTPVCGVGNGSAQLEGEFRVPVNFRWGEKHNYIKLRKAKEFLDELRGLRMIIDIPTMMQLGAQIDLVAKQIRFSELGRTIDLELVNILVARLGNKAISVLSMAGGGGFVYLTMDDAGYDAVELDPAARQLAKLLV
jgi:hypothetical protein